MQHNLVNHLRRVDSIPLAPVIANGISKYRSVAVEARRADCAADLRVSLEPVLGILVPKVEGAVAAGGAEGAVLRVEGDCVDRVDVGGVAAGVGGGGLAVAFEGEVGTKERGGVS